MEDYKKVEVNSYVKEGLESRELLPFEAEKYARIIARPGTIGEIVVSWSVDANGDEIKEKEDQVKLDETTKNPGWVVTKANSTGEPVIDKNGHKNEWIIEDSVFQKKYEADSENKGIFKPKGGIQWFVKIPENIILNQWGSDMKIAKGGYINITNADDMYGISQRDFDDTYKTSYQLRIEKAEANVPKWIEEGEAIIFPQRYEEWEKLVIESPHKIYNGEDISASLEIMKALKSGATMEEAKEILNKQNHSGASYALVRNILFNFSDKGPEFYEATADVEISDNIKKAIEEKKKENILLAEENAKKEEPSSMHM